MNNALVIADDLSGAAEIAGIGLRYGLPTQLLRDAPTECRPGLTVIDTDSRLLPASQAADAVNRAVRNLSSQSFDLIYKKTDSVMRGPILAELEALMRAFNLPAGLLAPQNPSRGRTIEAGEYRIDGIRLNATGFANDPEQPARSADVIELLGRSMQHDVRCLEPGGTVPSSGITIGNGRSAIDMIHWASKAAKGFLPTGGADFFEAILAYHGLRPGRPFTEALPPGPRLFVCGSASSYRRELRSRAEAEGVKVFVMPPGMSMDAMSFIAWSVEVCSELRKTLRAMIATPDKLNDTAGAPARLQTALSDVVANIVGHHPGITLLIEGGATASTICRRMNWHDFEVCGELAGGVVEMNILGKHEQRLIIKPGSYRWPDVVWR